MNLPVSLCATLVVVILSLDYFCLCSIHSNELIGLLHCYCGSLAIAAC